MGEIVEVGKKFRGVVVGKINSVCRLEIYGTEGELIATLPAESKDSQLAAVTAELDRMRDALEIIAKMSCDQSTDKVRMLAIRDGINVRAMGALCPDTALESEDK
jgi:hypothetical protein